MSFLSFLKIKKIGPSILFQILPFSDYFRQNFPLGGLQHSLLPRLYATDNPINATVDTSLYRYIARVMYDGTNFQGWQSQPGAVTIQDEIQKILSQRYQTKVHLLGSGRTDAGVHARGQLIHFDLPKAENDLKKLEYSLNSMLRKDIRIYDLSNAPTLPNLKFHAIVHSNKKMYTYRFYAGQCLDPLQRMYRAQIYRPLDTQKMRDALHYFTGTRDFRTFSNQIDKKEISLGFEEGELDTIRTVYSIEMIDEGQGNYRAEFLLDGALYKMVRNIMGALFAVGYGIIHAQDIPSLFELRSREKISKVVKAAPACGLTLERVWHDFECNNVK